MFNLSHKTDNFFFFGGNVEGGLDGNEVLILCAQSSASINSTADKKSVHHFSKSEYQPENEEHKTTC